VRIVRGRVAIVLLLVTLPAVATAAARPALVGTPRADVLLGRDGPERVDARGGDDRIAVEYDAGPDVIATTNPGCILQIGAAGRAAGDSRPVFHVVELLDASIRGRWPSGRPGHL